MKLDVSVAEMFEFAQRLSGTYRDVPPEPAIELSVALSPAPEVAPGNGKARRVGRPRKTKPVEQSERTMPTAGSAPQVLLALIRKKPQTSGELIEASKLAPGTVYTALSLMKNEGMIESRKNDDAPVSFWYER